MSMADTVTQPAMEGTWTLTSPDGRQWQASSPLKCCKSEMDERVPAAVALARILREAAAPVESERERTPEQYAIEHGRYLASAARQFMDACNAVWSAQQSVDDDETDTENEAAGLLNRLDEAKESQSEGWRALENAIYEFTKRADRAYPLKPALPAVDQEWKTKKTHDQSCALFTDAVRLRL